MTRFILIVLLFINGIVNAQLKKGNTMVGASLGSLFYNSSETILTVPAPTTGYTTRETHLGFTLTPSIGWFITDHLIVGTTINIGLDRRKVRSVANGNTFSKNESTTGNFGAGGFSRYYLTNKTTTVVPFLHLTVGAGTGIFKNNGFFYNGNAYKDTYTGKGSGIFNINSGLSLGITKLLSPTTGIDFSVGYQFTKMKNTITSVTYRDVDIDGDTDETYNSKPTLKTNSHGLIINFGFQVFMERKIVK